MISALFSGYYKIKNEKRKKSVRDKETEWLLLKDYYYQHDSNNERRLDPYTLYLYIPWNLWQQGKVFDRLGKFLDLLNLAENG
jgi:hypothetical protein